MVSEPESKSCREFGDKIANQLEVFINNLRATGDSLPSRNGKVNVTAVAAALSLVLKRKVDRQSLYKNTRCKALLEDAVRELGLRGVESREDEADNEKVALERRVTRLENQNTELYAEVCALRERLAQYQYIDETLIAQGKRVI
jgi:transposase-like protein